MRGNACRRNGQRSDDIRPPNVSLHARARLAQTLSRLFDSVKFDWDVAARARGLLWLDLAHADVLVRGSR